MKPPADQPLVSVVLGSFNRRPFLKAAIESARRELAGMSAEVIVVDGGSDDGSLKWLADQKDVITIVQHNHGAWRGKPVPRRSWGYFMNLAFKAAQGRFILMISDDCLLVPGAIANGIQRFEDLQNQGQKIGAVAFYWRNWPEEVEYGVGTTLGDRMFVNHGLFLRKAIEEVGWIDEDRYSFYFADGDLALRLWQAGYQVVDCKTSFVEHFTHATMTTRLDNAQGFDDKFKIYMDRWTGIFYDPAVPLIGGFKKLAHTDPHNTTQHFPRVQVTIHRLKHWAAKKLGRVPAEGSAAKDK